VHNANTYFTEKYQNRKLEESEIAIREGRVLLTNKFYRRLKHGKQKETEKSNEF